MANKKISALTDLGETPAVGDILPITDISDTTGSPNGTTKKVTVADLVAAAPQGDLVASNNLSDIGSAATARTNLSLGTAATLNVGTADTNVVQLSDVGGTAKLPAVDGSQLTGIEGTQILSTTETGGTKFLRENGDGTCSFEPAETSSLSYSTQTYTASGTPLAFTLTSAAKGKVVVVNESSPVYVTVPTGLGSGFNCRFVQLGTGQIVITPGSGATVGSYTPGTESYNATAGQNASVDLIPTGTDAYVVSGEANAAPFNNSYSVAFDGVDDSMTFSSAFSSIHSATNFSLSFYMNSTDTYGSTIKNYSTNVFQARPYTGIQGRFGDSTYHTIGSSNYKDGSWNHVVLTFANGVWKAYKNGSQDGSALDKSASFTSLPSTFGNGWVVSENDAAKFDEIAIWNSTLSDPEITAIYNGGLSPIDLRSNSGNYTSSANLQHYWRMGDNDGGSGTTITDLAGSSNGALINTTGTSTSGIVADTI